MSTNLESVSFKEFAKFIEKWYTMNMHNALLQDTQKSSISGAILGRIMVVNDNQSIKVQVFHP